MSTIISRTTPISAEEFLSLPDAKDFELVDGRLVERNMGMESSAIAIRIAFFIGLYCRNQKMGWLFGPDAGYMSFAEKPGKVRKPDLSFIATGRLPGGKIPSGYCTVAPDLAVEVISPGDLVYEIEEKMEEYLEAGVQLVWVVYPGTRTVRVHRQRSSSRGSVQDLKPSDVITGEEVLPGFSCAVQEFFE